MGFEAKFQACNGETRMTEEVVKRLVSKLNNNRALDSIMLFAHFVVASTHY